MKVYRVVLTASDKRRIEAKMNKLHQQKPKQKKHKIRCNRCKRKIYEATCRANGHAGFCSKNCLNNKSNNNALIRYKERNLSAEEKKRARQQRRVANQKAVAPSFYETREWRELRYRILRKYGFKCMACGAVPPPALHVDHVKPRSKFPHLELDENNLQVLCEDCNLGKSNLFEDDLRLPRL